MKKEEVEVLTHKYEKIGRVVCKYNNLVEMQETYEKVLDRFELHGSSVIKFTSPLPVGDFKVGSRRDLDKKIGLAIKNIISDEIDAIKKEIEELKYYE